MAEGQYKFSIGLDDKQLEMDIRSASKLFDNLVKEAQKAGVKIDQSFKNPFKELAEKGVPKIDTSNVAQATTQFNGLNVATQQLVRELPAASMGLNTFFLAVSNNLPVFADQIKRVNELNAELAEQGKPTTSAIKQIVSSLFSWQTALVLGVTALSMYGKEIGKWVVSLFKGKDAIDAIKNAERDLHEARMTGTIDAQEEATNLRLMVSAMQDASLSMDERKTAMQSLQDMYPEYFGNLSEEQMLYGDLTTSVETLIDRMVKLSTARNAVNQIVKNEENKALLEGTEGYANMMSAYSAFAQSGGYKYSFRNSLGQDIKSKEKRSGYANRKTPEFQALLDAQDDFLKELKNGNKEQKAQYDKIQDEYDGNVDAYLKAIDESNKKLTKTAKGAVTDPGLKAAEAEAKRKQAEAERLAREAEQKRKQAADATAKIAKDAVDARNDAIISAMEEGLAKEKAQINAEYDAKARDITERENELKKLQGGKLTERQMADFASLRASNEAMRANAIADAEEKATKQASDARDEALKDLADYYIQYGTIQEKILHTTEKYATLIANAKTEGERMSLEAERDAMLAEYQVAASEWAGELVDKTTGELNKMLEDLKSQVDAKQAIFNKMDSSDSEEAKNYRKQIAELTAKIAYLQSLLGKAGKSASDNNWAEATQVFQGIANAATEAANGIASFDENMAYALRSIAKLASVATNVTASIQGLKKAFDATAESVSALEKASAVLAVISAAIQAISFISNVFNENAEATRNAAEALAEYESAIARINNANISKAHSNIFGSDEYGEFSARLKAAQEYSKALEDTKKKAGKEVDYGWYLSNSERKDLNLRQSLGVMDNTTFIADQRSGWQKFWGTGDKNIKTTSLDEFYEDGVLNVDKLKAYYDTYKEYLSSEQQLLIEELISNGELLQENLDAITGYLQDKFGQMGQTISDAFVDAFENGTDAAEAMGDALTDILEDIAEDMAYSAFIQPLLDQANEQIDALNKKRGSGKITEEEFFNQLMFIGTQLMENVSMSQEAYNEYMAAIKQAGEEQGLSMWDGSGGNRETGIARASQESVDELNGRATAIQSHTYAIMQSQQQLTQDAADMLRHLANIDANTAELRTMRRDMALMRSDINSIVTQGIIMR